MMRLQVPVFTLLLLVIALPARAEEKPHIRRSNLCRAKAAG